MRDDHDPAAPRDQVLRQPADALDVQVVRGLVEHDEVGVADQRGGEGDAALLPTGQAVDGAVQVVQAQSVQHVADLRIGRPLVLGAVPGQHDVADPRSGRQRVALREVGQIRARRPG